MIIFQPPNKEAPPAIWAEFYASLNWSIIPLYSINDNLECACGRKCKSPGKHPLVKKGVLEASCDINQIRAWWKKWPAANIGIATELSHLLVIDIDPRNGSAAVLPSFIEHHQISILPQVRSGVGHHLYFIAQDALPSKINLLPGIDLKSRGGYIVAPPSKHKVGNKYEWLEKEIAIPLVPKSLYSQKVCTTARKKETKILEGQRNACLASVAGSLRKYGLERDNINELLGLINKKVCRPKLNEQEIHSIAFSISKYRADQTEEWQQPEPLIKPTASHNMETCLLPPKSKAWIEDIAYRMQVPVDFVAIPHLVSLSSVLASKAVIFPKQRDNWQVVPNLWGAIIAPPGSFKSPAMQAALAPLEKLSKKTDALYYKAYQSWQAEKEVLLAMIEALKTQLMKNLKNNTLENIDPLRDKLKKLQSDLITQEPKHIRFKTNDATTEKIADLLQHNASLLIYRDELAGWLAGMQKQGREGDREFYLEAWNGDGRYTVDRIGRGTLQVDRLCLAILGGIQPSKLDKYLLAEKNLQDGLLQRFQLLIYPKLDPTWQNVDVLPNEILADRIYKTFDAVLQTTHKQSYRFTKGAQYRFNQWRKALESRLRSQELLDENFESHLAKYRSLVPSLSLLFEVIAQKGRLETFQEVTEESLLLALKWAIYLEQHTHKIYGLDETNHHQGCRAFLNKILKGAIETGQSWRDINRHHWQYLTGRALEKTVDILAQKKWLRVMTQATNGRPTKILTLNPNITYHMIQKELCK